MTITKYAQGEVLSAEAKAEDPEVEQEPTEDEVPDGDPEDE